MSIIIQNFKSQLMYLESRLLTRNEEPYSNDEERFIQAINLIKLKSINGREKEGKHPKYQQLI